MPGEPVTSPSSSVATVVVDRTRCEGTTFCESIAPEVFRLDDDGFSMVIRTAIDAAQLPRVEDAAATCPTLAILVSRRV